LTSVFLISDLKTGSHKTGLWKAEWKITGKDLDIIDLSHNISPNNTIEASFVAEHLRHSAIKGYILHARVGHTSHSVLYQHLDNVFIFPNNGLIGMLFQQIEKQNCYLVPKEREIVLALELQAGKLSGEYRVGENLVIRYRKQAQLNENIAVAECIFIDTFGNCYFNIKKEEFDSFSLQKKFKIQIQHYRGEVFRKIFKSIEEVSEGDAFFSFNSIGYLKLQISMGNAATLFRIREDSKIIIEIE